MNILFLGTFLPKEFEEKFNTLSAAGNQFQCNMFRAMQSENSVKAMTYITAPGVELGEKELLDIKKQGIEVYLPKVDKVKAFINFRTRLKEMIEWADCVVTYNVVYAWFGLNELVKKRNAQSILILADYTPVSEEHNLLKKVYSLLSKREFGLFDKVVLLSEGGRKYLKKGQESTVLNGCIDWDLFKDIEATTSEDKYNIVYTGFIGRVTGVDILLDAFKQIDNPNVRLIICGQGNELDDLIQAYAKNDQRIVYKGYISKAEYISVLNEANLLVNPRNMNLLQNQNNFPSKVLEYIAAGRPCLSTKFCGWENYKNNMIFCDSNDKDMYEKIVEIMRMKDSQIMSVYLNNRRFAQTKTWDKQIDYVISGKRFSEDTKKIES